MAKFDELRQYCEQYYRTSNQRQHQRNSAHDGRHQVTGETAKQLSERFGKIIQDRSSVSINRSDTSISRSKQFDSAIPASTIATLSSGDFVGMVADNPDCKIELKSFHCQILNDHQALKQKQKNYKPIPVIRKVNNGMIQKNYLNIK